MVKKVSRRRISRSKKKVSRRRTSRSKKKVSRRRRQRGGMTSKRLKAMNSEERKAWEIKKARADKMRKRWTKIWSSPAKKTRARGGVPKPPAHKRTAHKAASAAIATGYTQNDDPMFGMNASRARIKEFMESTQVDPGESESAGRYDWSAAAALAREEASQPWLPQLGNPQAGNPQAGNPAAQTGALTFVMNPLDFARSRQGRARESQAIAAAAARATKAADDKP